MLRMSALTESRREARSLLALALDRDQTFLIANPDYELSDTEQKLYFEFVSRRSNREPFQHISGVQEFWGRDFLVNPDVMIPRPETEMIVEETLTLLSGKKPVEICEVGIGSGCISVSILCEVKSAIVLGLDISERAIAVAARNAEKHCVADRLNFGISDVFGYLGREKFDMIVSNPPYVPASEVPRLQVEVKDFDPIIALTDGHDGLSLIRQIIRSAPVFLKPNGFLLMEIGFNQSSEVCKMFDFGIWKACEVLPDLQGIPRLVKAQILCADTKELNQI